MAAGTDVGHGAGALKGAVLEESAQIVLEPSSFLVIPNKFYYLHFYPFLIWPLINYS